MKKYLPFLQWLPNYKRENLSGDISAGLTVGVMLIPQGMAYSMLAGLPPIYGLYASTIPLILYALFGTSRQLAVGPVAMVALLIASGVGALTEVGSDNFIGLAILLSLMVGVIQLAMGLFRLGFLVNFLSHPVISGFTSAAALIIGFSQLKHLLGLDIARGKVHETLQAVFVNAGDINWITFAIGAGAIATILILRRISRKIPSPLVVVVLGLGAVYLMGLHEQGVAIVKNVPGGLPSLSAPQFSWEAVQSLLPIALTISFVGFMESIAVAKAIQAKHKNYEVSANQELIGLGFANIGGSLFGAFPTTGGFSRTAVNDQAGAKTGLASIISAALVGLTLLFLTDYFYFLPKAVLASIIMVAVFGLIDFKEAKYLWKTNKVDFVLFMATALATLILGVEEGILTGVGLSMAMLIYRVSYPHIAELGKIPGTDQYMNVKRYKLAQTDEETLIVRLDAQLYFANLDYFTDRLKKLEEKRENLKSVVINAEAINGLDSSAIHMLTDLVKDHKDRDIRVLFTGVKGPVRDSLKKSDMVGLIGEGNFYLTVDDAINKLEGRNLEYDRTIPLQANV